MKTQVIIPRDNYSTFNSELNFFTVATPIHSELYFKVHPQYGKLLSAVRLSLQSHEALLGNVQTNVHDLHHVGSDLLVVN